MDPSKLARRKTREPEVVTEAPAVAGSDVPEGHKVCAGCGKAKPYAWFTRDRRNPDGLGDTCAPCRRGKADVKRRKHAQVLASQARTEEGFVRVSFAEFFQGDEDAIIEHFQGRGFVQDEGGRWVSVEHAEIPF